ncbi:outer membrane protein assembly factor BamB [Rehaibacterium terrae]|jgi:outer membrane protein assembly factor BamB|uniref:Outer membrane protein assembly factor BamB n=1 Tax=Rehaibacterium terrae TaxID=1341696 RepID=A0A7W7XYV0_9GAMM|nr:outer membrane protein assembly factor BamB [Rehaibacterium terrae]MBB5014948.1 outer membrane protein assembly factor BamB [Rehaibacterium terrae]
MMRRLIVLFVCAALLAGCGTRVGKWFGSSSKDNVDAPAELTDFAPSVGVDKLWSLRLGKGERRLWIRQAPAVVEGRVYAATLQGRVVALDLESGRELWRSETGMRLSGGPGAAGGFVVVGSLDGDVLALDADSGAERWRTRVSSEVISRPLLAHGMAVVRSNDGRVFGLDLGEGARRWVFDRGIPALTVRGNASPVLGQGLVYLGYDDGTVVALRVQDGLRVWEQVVAEPDGRSELERMADVDGDLQVGLSEVFAISFKGQMLAMDAANGRPLWTRDTGSYAGLALLGDRLVVADKAGSVWAIDRNSSSALWRQEALAHRWLTTPAVQGDYAVVGDLQGYLHWLRLGNGELAARVRLGKEPIRATPQVSPEGILVAIDTYGELAAYRLGGP